jgi:hypothetical protein
MDRSAAYLGKRFRFRQHNFRPLLLRVVWAINILLFSMIFWAFVFCLRNLGRIA